MVLTVRLLSAIAMDRRDFRFNVVCVLVALTILTIVIISRLAETFLASPRRSSCSFQRNQP